MARNEGIESKVVKRQSEKPVAPIDIWEQMDALVPNQVAAPPPNSFTIDMFAERRGFSPSWAAKVVGKLVKQGKLTRVKAGGKLWFTIV